MFGTILRTSGRQKKKNEENSVNFSFILRDKNSIFKWWFLLDFAGWSILLIQADSGANLLSIKTHTKMCMYRVNSTGSKHNGRTVYIFGF